MPKQQIIQAGEGPNYEWSNDHIYVKTSHDLTAGRVTVVEDTLKPGFHLARHHHREMTEVFYILAGEVTFKFDDETIQAAPGMTINIPPHTWHEGNSVPGGKLMTIFSPGGFEGYFADLAPLSPAHFSSSAFP